MPTERAFRARLYGDCSYSLRFHATCRCFEDQPLFLPSDTLYARFLNSTSTGGLFGKCVNVTAGLLPSCPGLWFGTFLANMLLLDIASAVPLDVLPLQLQCRLFCDPLKYKRKKERYGIRGECSYSKHFTNN